MNIFEKIMRADPTRKTRFHDQQGNLLPLQDLGMLPRRFVESVGVKFGIYPQEPWWPASAKRRIEGLLKPSWNVVEFGSGMSTAWLAAKVNRVVAVEDNRDWQERVSATLRRRGASNAEVLLRDKVAYVDLRPEGAVDLVIIDGQRRYDCILWAIENVRKGGYIYLDNSDRAGGADSEGARAEMLVQAERGALRIEFHRGIPPGLFALTEGALGMRL